MQLIRFIITGLISNAINFFIYALCYSFFGSIIVASSSGYVSGLCYSYFIGRSWVFDASGQSNIIEALKFLAIYTIGGFGMISIIYICNISLNIDYRICWLFGASFAVLNNFVGSKFIVFKVS